MNEIIFSSMSYIESNIKQLVGEMMDLHQNFPTEIKAFIEQNTDLGLLIYLLTSSLSITNDEKQKLYEESNIIKKGTMLLKYLEIADLYL